MIRVTTRRGTQGAASSPRKRDDVPAGAELVDAREEPPAESRGRSQFFLASVWVTVTAVLGAAFLLTSSTEALGDDGTESSSSAAANFPVAGVDLDELDIEPDAVYAGAAWSIDDARSAHVDGLLERSMIEVDVTVVNTLDATQVRIPDSVVSLATADESLADGAIGEARFVDAGARLTLDPGEQIQVTIDFEVGFTQAPDLADFALRIAEPNRVPVTIPLVGDPGDSSTTVFAAVDTTARSTTDPDDAARQIVIAPIAASVDVNAGPYRAAVGEELAIVQVAVQRAEAGADNGYLQLDYWTLEADGQPVAPILVAPALAVESNEDEVTLVFAFPEGADQLVLVAGGGAGDTGDGALDFAVVLPS